jgi:hypothetical protein
LDVIQKHYQVINNSLHIIDDKEKESSMVGSKFQEFIVWRKNLNVPRLAPFSEFEQIKGETTLMTWENNIEQSKRSAKEEQYACLDALSAVDLEMT